MTPDCFRQRGFDVRLEFAAEGVAAFADCAVLVVVDTLVFSTSVDIALGRGARVRPMRWRNPDDELAAVAAGAELAGSRWTLRPSSLVDIPSGTLLALGSPNGGALSVLAGGAGAHVLAGCPRNAAAVAARAASLANGGAIGIVAAGERWNSGDGPLRPCVADALGAGSVVAALLELGLDSVSPEARFAAHGYLGCAGSGFAEGLATTSSGRELVDRGDGGDVGLAAMIGVSEVAPLLLDGVYTA